MAFQSLKGQLLLDNGRLQGTFFFRTAILICQHDAEGAFGLVLNRPTGQQVGDVLSGQLRKDWLGQGLLLGGPVQPQAMSFLLTEEFLPGANVLPHLHVGHSLDELVELSDSFSPTRRVRIFAGYAGWSPGQLDEEMKRDVWLTHPASVDLVFHTPIEELWPMVLKKKGWKYQLIARQPEDLSSN